MTDGGTRPVAPGRGRVLALAVAAAAIVACRRVEEPPPSRTVPNQTRTTDERPRRHPAGPEPRTVVVPDFADLADRMAPSVVGVVTKVSDGRGTLRGLGSGMVVTAAGQILTNEHVVARASEVEVVFLDGRRLPARIVYADALVDLALLEVSATGLGLAPVELREDDPRPGTWVMAMGQPFGLGHTVTVGVVSGLGRDWDDLGRPADLAKDGAWSFIQTDASINIGNSGGPLVDPDGRVVGVTTAVRADGQGIAFAVPAPMARRFLEEVWTRGYLRHTRLGVRAENAAPDAVPGRAGAVRITKVEPDGPGAKAGLEPGDLVIAVDGRPVASVAQLAYHAQVRGVGAKIPLSILRDGGPPRQVLIVPAQAPDR
ncbi:MAG: PDZ domain-containing protein [Deltaproteobacteria bacterium]|nr:MAG: PDZ domain-containing protein [Deltaproteobacteria bacterium]